MEAIESKTLFYSELHVLFLFVACVCFIFKCHFVLGFTSRVRSHLWFLGVSQLVLINCCLGASSFVFIRSSEVFAPWFSSFSLQVVLLLGHPVRWTGIKAASRQTETKKMNTSLCVWVFTLTKLTVGAFIPFLFTADFGVLSNETPLNVSAQNIKMHYSFRKNLALHCVSPTKVDHWSLVL